MPCLHLQFQFGTQETTADHDLLVHKTRSLEPQGLRDQGLILENVHLSARVFAASQDTNIPDMRLKSAKW
jgi:hypothetical protein